MLWNRINDYAIFLPLFSNQLLICIAKTAEKVGERRVDYSEGKFMKANSKSCRLRPSAVIYNFHACLLKTIPNVNVVGSGVRFRKVYKKMYKPRIS